MTDNTQLPAGGTMAFASESFRFVEATSTRFTLNAAHFEILEVRDAAGDAPFIYVKGVLHVSEKHAVTYPLLPVYRA